MLRNWSTTSTFLLFACGGGMGGPLAEPDLDRPLGERPVLVDSNPDPGIVEVELVAAEGNIEYLEGKPAAIWGYRDGTQKDQRVSVPGPLLLAQEGDQIVVHFRNLLPVATTIHWHGLRLPAAHDGSTSTQNPVLPGDTFEYRFRANDPGTFWYHPHVAADVQIERGLYAPLVVEAKEPLEVDGDRTLILDDVKINADGTLSETTDALDIMLGRQGNVLLVNGQTDRQITFRRGDLERWRLINAANGRYFNLELEGASFTVVGWDGGLLEEPYEAERLLIAPGERYEVVLRLSGEEGELRHLRTLHYDRGHDIPDPGPRDLLELVLFGEPTSGKVQLPERLRALSPLPVDQNTVVRPFVLAEIEDQRGARFFINDELWPFNTPVMVEHQALEIWEVSNRTEMDHPFHLHGMFFQVLEVGGVPPEHLGYKDTVNIPRNTDLRFAVRYEELGMWMFHCHILEHAERGMMGELMVEHPG